MPDILPGISAQGVPATPRAYFSGTLSYTRAGLISLFAWLLWGDFIFMLMEAVMPALLPLLLKDHGANNHEIVTIATTLYMVMNAALNPVVSFQSDRLRSRWGRRRPFILATTPLVVLFLIAVPFSPEILTWATALPCVAHLVALAPVAPIILMFGVLVAGFQIFNMFVSSVYYYLIRDVVPVEFIGRFFGLFRIFGTLATTIFNYFIFGQAEHHMKAIFVVIALIYGVFMSLMAWQVKEGTYPPPPATNGRWWHGIQTYLRECFGHQYYWWVFLAYSALSWGAAGNILSVFFYRDELGLSLILIGKVTAWSGIIFVLCAYPFGMLMDRWGCHKTLLLGQVFVIITSLLTYVFAVDALSGIVWTLLRNIPISLCGLALAKWTIEVYPRERYGQFGSAGALFASIGGIIAAQLYGYLVDWIKVYRIFLLWHSLFAVVALGANIVVYRRWKALGGPLNYSPP